MKKQHDVRTYLRTSRIAAYGLSKKFISHLNAQKCLVKLSMKRATQIEHVCGFLNEADRGCQDDHDHYSTHLQFSKVKQLCK
jgi:hypothetical protein